MKIDRFISVIAPLYNNEDLVADFIKDTIAVLKANYTNYELVLVDDGSSDKTVERVSGLLDQYEGIRLVRLSREFGEEIALSAGLDTVIGDYTIVMLPHMDPPEKIPELVQHCIDGYDVVYGIRDTSIEKGWLSRKAKAAFFWYCRKVLKFNLSENATLFSCLSRQSVNAIIKIKDHHRYFRLFSSLIGYAQKPVIYTPITRGVYTRKHSFIESSLQAFRVLIEYSVHPLRFASLLGVIAAVSNLVYIGYIVAVYFIKDNVIEGWTTLSFQNALQFFFIAVILTIISEYIGRVLNRLKDRPLYYQMEEKNSSLLLTDMERHNIVEESESVDI